MASAPVVVLDVHGLHYYCSPLLLLPLVAVPLRGVVPIVLVLDAILGCELEWPLLLLVNPVLEAFCDDRIVVRTRHLPCVDLPKVTTTAVAWLIVVDVGLVVVFYSYACSCCCWFLHSTYNSFLVAFVKSWQ